MTTLRRTLGLPGLTFFGVGMILGAGVYSVIGAAAGKADDALWLSFLLAAIAALFTGLSYAELATMHPKAGAEFTYVREAFPRGRGVATVIGLLVVLSSCATGATVALAFAGYLSRLVAVPQALIAVALILAASAVNVVGIRSSTAVTATCTVVEVAGLVVVIALATGDPDFGQALLTVPHAGVLAGAGLVFFAYLGFESIATLAEETRDPGHALPRAVLASLAIATTLYVLVGLGVVALVDAETLASSDAPLADAIARWPRVASALAAVALFATANTALGNLLTASRVLNGMAREGDLPSPLAALLPGRRTPWIASLAAMGAALALLPAGGLTVVAGLASFGSLVAFVAVNASCIALRLRKPRAKRPFRIPVAIAGVPVAPVLGILAALALLTSFERAVWIGGLLALAGCTVAISVRWLVTR